ncbi:hypothetical protein AB6A40_008001 [Gnathostoma spinigerum]|uniref:Serine carboxypeptidase n=1 Tax=Gnathostoma spinigerum TaxID=75299 RepID=A0ABD6EXH6_9BILA
MDFAYEKHTCLAFPNYRSLFVHGLFAVCLTVHCSISSSVVINENHFPFFLQAKVMLNAFFCFHLLVTIITAEGTVRETLSRRLVNRPFPGAAFEYSCRIESGYLSGNEEGNLKLFYMLFASQSKGDNVPLLLWLNGGPGCSSLVGAFAEIGPFLVNKDGSLYQNAYAFNRKADLLFLETPNGTGFSYDSKNLSGVVVGDDETASMLMKHFFKTTVVHSYVDDKACRMEKRQSLVNDGRCLLERIIIDKIRKQFRFLMYIYMMKLRELLNFYDSDMTMSSYTTIRSHNREIVKHRF